MRNAGRPFTRPLRNTLACASVLAIASTGCNSTQERTVPTDPVASQADEESSSTTAPLVAGPVAAQDADAQLRQDAAKLSLQMQKRASLVEGNLARAQDFVDRLMFEAAEREAMQALDLDPENVEAKQLLTEIRAMLGRPLDQTQTLAETLSTEYGLRVQQLKADAQDNLNSGRQALARGEYDKAISELSLVLNSVRWAPYAIDWDGIETEAQALMTQAEAERDAAVVAQREAAQREAHQAIQQREDAERARREAVMANILEQAIDAFDAADYDRAIDLADEALRLDARNDRALELRDAAFRAGRAKVRSDYIDDKREEFARWREHLQELEIPWTDTITYPDREDWRELTERRSSREGFDLSSYVSVSEAELRRQMSTRTVILPGIQDEESLRAVVDIIRNFTGMALVVDTAAENVVLDEGIIFDLNIENPLTVTQALNLITDIAGEDVTWTVRHDTVLVTTREKARGEPVIVNHDVQDLILGLTDFTGPRIDRLRLLDELEDEDGGGPFGGILDKPSLIEVDDLVVLIQDNVGVGTWDEEGVSIESGEGFILIVHSADVQAQVREFLEDLRRFNSSLVTIESRFMTVADNWIQELGVDFRGLDNINVTDVTNGLEDMASRGLDNGGTGSAGQGAAGPPSAGFFFDDGQDGDFRGTTQNFFGDNLGNALSTVGGLSFQLTFLNDLQLSTILRAVEKSSQFELIKKI